MTWKGFKDIQATIEINLKKDLDDIWNNLDKDAKWGVKKALKEGLVVKEANEKEIKDFYNIYIETCIRGNIVPEKIEKIEKDKLFVCKKEEKVIAGAATIEREEKIILHFNASKADYLKYQPNNILYWKIIEYGKEKKKNVFDLGGYQINASGHLKGINKFKERWGGEIKEYYIYSKNPFYIIGRKIIRNCHKLKDLRDKIKIKSYLKKNGKD